MITRKSFIVAGFALLCSVAAMAQSHEEVPVSGDHQIEVAKQIQLYPNPAVEFLKIKFDNPCAKRMKLTVHNVIGNAIKVEVETLDDHELQLDVRDLPTGYYMLSIQDPDHSSKNTFKFLKR